MLGFRFIKFEPNEYIFRYRKGRIVSQGAGLSFYYFAPRTSLIVIPVESSSAAFIFEEVTSDFQTITVQGEVIFRIADADKIRQQINFTINRDREYISEDPAKLPERIINVVRVVIKKQIEGFNLRECMRSSEKLSAGTRETTASHQEISSLGLEIIGLNILSIRPTAETARALEAETRESILKEADDALYSRRNSAVEQERKIKENELNTEIAVENKKRQIREAQLDAEKMAQLKQQELQKSEMLFRINQEQENKKLVQLSVDNKKLEADSRAYAAGALMSAYSKAPADVLKAITVTGMPAEKMISMAFRELAENAEKIGELNISPDLLQSLLKKSEKGK